MAVTSLVGAKLPSGWHIASEILAPLQCTKNSTVRCRFRDEITAFCPAVKHEKKINLWPLRCVRRYTGLGVFEGSCDCPCGCSNSSLARWLRFAHSPLPRSSDPVGELPQQGLEETLRVAPDEESRAEPRPGFKGSGQCYVLSDVGALVAVDAVLSSFDDVVGVFGLVPVMKRVS